ncbi:MAG: hypothetical protein D6689_10510, partial [Deltaproteobacteria bacterium]
LDEPGKGIQGIYEGAGAPVEIEDAAGDARALQTHVFALSSGARVAILGSHQLDHELPALVGHEA